MATPTNPLDAFVTYIAHYELHAANSWDVLKEVQSSDFNGTTSDRFANGTLLINTRKDAHQQIDNVRFRYLGPSSDPSGAMAPIDEISLEVTEPNGTFFIEKIENLAAKFSIKDLMGGMIFGLKIFFVGRLPDGSELTVPFGKIIPMQLIKFDAKFSYKGGEYSMGFYSSGTALASSPLRPSNGISRAAAFSNKNVTFEANTVQEGIELLQQKLNDNYQDVFEKDLEDAGARRVQYKINIDPAITGKLTLSTKEDYTPTAKSQLTFTPKVDIGTMVRTVVHSSKDVNEMISESNKALTKQMHKGVKLPVYQTFYYLQDSILNVVYNVKLYEGGKGDIFEFDYYFSGPGKNVDVIDFECRFPSMITWMSSAVSGTNLNQNSDSRVPGAYPEYFANNLVHPDMTRFELLAQPIARRVIPALVGDIAFLPATPYNESGGQVRHTFDAVPAARLAFETVSKACSALDTQLSFTIRGHLGILEKVITQPDGGSEGFGVSEGVWIKVNIYNADGSPFFYTGLYRLLTVDNIFSGGKFTQILTVMMMDKE